jgi:hypothetical protein
MCLLGVGPACLQEQEEQEEPQYDGHEAGRELEGNLLVAIIS